MTGKKVTHLRPVPAVTWVDPALELAFAWAEQGQNRDDLYSIEAFVDLIRTLDRYQRGERA